MHRLARCSLRIASTASYFEQLCNVIDAPKERHPAIVGRVVFGDLVRRVVSPNGARLRRHDAW